MSLNVALVQNEHIVLLSMVGRRMWISLSSSVQAHITDNVCNSWSPTMAARCDLR